MVDPWLSGTSPCTTSNGKDFVIKWNVYSDTSSTSNIGWYPASGSNTYTRNDLSEAWHDGAGSVAAMQHVLQEGKEYGLPDGGKIIIDDMGNYRIDDKDAKVVYRASRIREFSPHLNASDMLAQFVEYSRKLGVSRQDVLNLPIHLFISWLIIEAAERDGDEIPEDVTPIECSQELVELKKPRCLECGRFIKRLHYRYRFPFCDPMHAQLHLQHAV